MGLLKHREDIVKKEGGYINQVTPCMPLPALSIFLKICKLGDHLPCCNAFLGEIQRCRGSDPYLQYLNVIPLKLKELFSFIIVKVLLQKAFLTASILNEHEGKKYVVIWRECLVHLV